MKLSKGVTAIIVTAIVIFISTLLYLYNRSISDLEARMAGEIKARAQAAAKAAFDKERAEFNRKQKQWIETATQAGKAYAAKAEDAERYRKDAERARKDNAANLLTWEEKYKKCDDGQKAIIKEWGASDIEKDKLHLVQVTALDKQITGLNIRLTDIESKYNTAESKRISLSIDNLVLKRKLRRRVVFGPSAIMFYRNGQPDAALGFGATYRVGSL